jgi:hypothetical protein
VPRPSSRQPSQKKSSKALAKVAPKPALNIITAFDDPDLFGKFFVGDSWNGWRSVLKAAFALPMSEADTAFFRSVAGDRLAPTQAVREFWAVVGRRGGKDSVASAIAAYVAATFTGQDKLRPGEKAVVVCLAVDREQAKVLLNYIRSYFTDIPLLKGMLTRETAVGFELNNSVDIQILTGNFRSVRGRAILLAVLDEVAFLRDESSAAPDMELYKAIVPGTATLDGQVIGISSAYRKAGLLYKKHKKHFGQPGDVLVIQAATRVLNPLIPQEMIDRELADDPAGARTEYLAEFRDEIGGWLAVETIEAAVDRGVAVRPPITAVHKYRAACDPSGGAKDSFTAAVAHDEHGAAVLDCLIEIKPPFNPAEAVTQVAAMLRAYDLSEATGDRYAAEWVVSAFAANGIIYRHSERDRSAIYQDCLPLFTSGRARILDNSKLVNQFAALERKISPMGKDRIDHGQGGHDDLCNSAALAMVLATTAKKFTGLMFG